MVLDPAEARARDEQLMTASNSVINAAKQLNASAKALAEKELRNASGQFNFKAPNAPGPLENLMPVSYARDPTDFSYNNPRVTIYPTRSPLAGPSRYAAGPHTDARNLPDLSARRDPPNTAPTRMRTSRRSTDEGEQFTMF